MPALRRLEPQKRMRSARRNARVGEVQNRDALRIVRVRPGRDAHAGLGRAGVVRMTQEMRTHLSLALTGSGKDFHPFFFGQLDRVAFHAAGAGRGGG